MIHETTPRLPYDEMRADLIRHLRVKGISDERVLEAIGQVPREEFVPSTLRHAAYDDHALPIGLGQTISQPFTVAFMTQSLALTGKEKVLEVGAGTGYGAAVLSRLAGRVYSVELIPELVKRASERLARLGYDNVTVIEADGSAGYPAEAPYDAISVTAGAEALPLAYLEQLAEGGRLVIPLGVAGWLGQTLQRFTRSSGRIVIETLGGFAFVPLRGRFGLGG